MSDKTDKSQEDTTANNVQGSQSKYKPEDLGPTCGVPPSFPTNISDEDKLILDQLKYKRELSLATAEKELARSESADLSYKYVVLQLYMKYHLTENDAINENGDILYGGGKKKGAVK